VPVRELGHAAVMPPVNFTGVMNLTVDLRRSDDSVADTDVLRVSWTPNAAETVVPKPVKTTTVGSGGASFAPPSAPAAAEPEPPAANEVAPPQPQPTRTATAVILRHLDREEIVNLLKRGQLALDNGDIAAARLLLRRAAEAGDAPAAMALAATFDPRVLRQLGVLGSNADVEKARSWYQKAAEMGSAEASQRLQLLAQQSR
jgi:TPR repeat protein